MKYDIIFQLFVHLNFSGNLPKSCLKWVFQLMLKASKKREEPDFDRKRLVLAPSGDTDRPRTTDEESDDSCGRRKMYGHYLFGIKSQLFFSF